MLKKAPQNYRQHTTQQQLSLINNTNTPHTIFAVFDRVGGCAVAPLLLQSCVVANRTDFYKTGILPRLKYKQKNI